MVNSCDYRLKMAVFCGAIAGWGYDVMSSRAGLPPQTPQKQKGYFLDCCDPGWYLGWYLGCSCLLICDYCLLRCSGLGGDFLSFYIFFLFLIFLYS